MEVVKGSCFFCENNIKILKHADAVPYLQLLPSMLGSDINITEFQKCSNQINLCPLCCYNITESHRTREKINACQNKEFEIETGQVCILCNINNNLMVMYQDWKYFGERLKMIPDIPNQEKYNICFRCFQYIDFLFKMKNLLYKKYPKLKFAKKKSLSPKSVPNVKSNASPIKGCLKSFDLHKPDNLLPKGLQNTLNKVLKHLKILEKNEKLKNDINLQNNSQILKQVPYVFLNRDELIPIRSPNKNCKRVSFNLQDDLIDTSCNKENDTKSKTYKEPPLRRMSLFNDVNYQSGITVPDPLDITDEDTVRDNNISIEGNNSTKRLKRRNSIEKIKSKKRRKVFENGDQNDIVTELIDDGENNSVTNKLRIKFKLQEKRIKPVVNNDTVELLNDSNNLTYLYTGDVNNKSPENGANKSPENGVLSESNVLISPTKNKRKKKLSSDSNEKNEQLENNAIKRKRLSFNNVAETLTKQKKKKLNKSKNEDDKSDEEETTPTITFRSPLAFKIKLRKPKPKPKSKKKKKYQTSSESTELNVQEELKKYNFTKNAVVKIIKMNMEKYLEEVKLKLSDPEIIQKYTTDVELSDNSSLVSQSAIKEPNPILLKQPKNSFSDDPIKKKELNKLFVKYTGCDDTVFSDVSFSDLDNENIISKNKETNKLPEGPPSLVSIQEGSKDSSDVDPPTTSSSEEAIVQICNENKTQAENSTISVANVNADDDGQQENSSLVSDVCLDKTASEALEVTMSSLQRNESEVAETNTNLPNNSAVENSLTEDNLNSEPDNPLKSAVEGEEDTQTNCNLDKELLPINSLSNEENNAEDTQTKDLITNSSSNEENNTEINHSNTSLNEEESLKDSAEDIASVSSNCKNFDEETNFEKNTAVNNIGLAIDFVQEISNSDNSEFAAIAAIQEQIGSGALLAKFINGNKTETIDLNKPINSGEEIIPFLDGQTTDLNNPINSGDETNPFVGGQTGTTDLNNPVVNSGEELIPFLGGLTETTDLNNHINSGEEMIPFLGEPII